MNFPFAFLDAATTVFLACAVVAGALAIQLTHYSLAQNRDRSLVYWAAGAWIFAAASATALFALRIPWAVIVVSLQVTVGYGVLLLGSQRISGAPVRPWWMGTAVVAHSACLVGLFWLGSLSVDRRMVINGLFWLGFCIASWRNLRRASGHFWGAIDSPASIFLAQAAFHFLRSAAVIVCLAFRWYQALDALFLAGALGVLLFMVPLFVALPLAHLGLKRAELAEEEREVGVLTSLLPICAWCKKVRNDGGYWSEIDDFFSQHKEFKVKRTLCQACASRLTSGEPR